MEKSDSTLTVVTWNVNGIRSLYKNSLEIKQGLDAFGADVVCFQETKVARDALEQSTAIVEGYNSYYAFPRNKCGYSGVATYCKNEFTPYKAEEGLTGTFSSKADDTVGCYRNIDSKFAPCTQKYLDCEGRAVITQHKFAVPGCEEKKDLAVVNVYCPRAANKDDVRLKVKREFYDLLEERVRGLVESGSHVMVVGDINTAHKPIDECNPADIEQFINPCRMWLNHILRDPEGQAETDTQADRETQAETETQADRETQAETDTQADRETQAETETQADLEAQFKHRNFYLIDAFRYLHPTEENAYTCWSTKLNARATNYGMRLDYILIDDGLKVRLKDCSILRDVTGSDHCPVRVVLNINGLRSPNIPSSCTKFYLEFMGTQKKLSDFYKTDTSIISQQHKEHDRKRKASPIKGETKRQKGIEKFLVKSTVLLENVTASSVKFDDSETTSDRQHEGNVAENTMSTSTEAVLPGKHMDPNLPSTSGHAARVSNVKQIDLMKENPVVVKLTEAAEKWRQMFPPPKPPPICLRHGEPCVQKRVKKKGINFNRKFWVCARGEGHHKNPASRCGFFLWDSSW